MPPESSSLTEAAPDPGPAPASVAAVLGDRTALMARYAHLLATSGSERGLIGPREVPRLWERHLANCLAVAELLPDSASVADVGTGAGLPGLVLAIARPDIHMTLIEPLLRRTTWLDEVVSELALPNVTVSRARADALHGAQMFHVVTSRAVAPLATLATWCLPLVESGGRMLALKGRSAADELAGAQKAIRKSGGLDAEVLQVGSHLGPEPTTVVSVRRR